jgi:signal transduction histidine kinase
MTEKAREDYQSLKEFTENASHELQTPTAIIRGKLDLLMESDIRDEQAILIARTRNTRQRSRCASATWPRRPWLLSTN